MPENLSVYNYNYNRSDGRLAEFIAVNSNAPMPSIVLYCIYTFV